MHEALFHIYICRCNSATRRCSKRGQLAGIKREARDKLKQALSITFELSAYRLSIPRYRFSFFSSFLVPLLRCSARIRSRGRMQGVNAKLRLAIFRLAYMRCARECGLSAGTLQRDYSIFLFSSPWFTFAAVLARASCEKRNKRRWSAEYLW